ncbi:MAG: ATP-binding cassette domain-containing protein [Oscillospiraceae bacterium]|jgi:zinc transport system ATP-binding protein|nr:ATP-binding cassette domain-containing protein [Oscillospiraceae bacterium]
MAKPEPLLVCENLTLGYEGKAVVSGLSFSVSEGDYLCVMGENGSGKSTLLKTILKLQAPLSGRITVGGANKSAFGYLPQQTASQRDFPASVREIVRSGCLGRCGLRPRYGKAEKELAEENMRKLGVAPYAGRCFRELSGGLQRRALLARALCAAQRALLLDEPASGLDPEATREMYALIAGLNAAGTTVIMVSHDIAASLEYVSHVLHIGLQKTLFFGAKDEYAASGVARAGAAAGGAKA